MGEDRTFKPTVQWMAEKYEELNSMLFNGELGPCNFGIFTTGKGSQGGVLGWFKITGRNIKAERYNRHMYADNPTWSDVEYINRGNFYDICQPKIELNGNYSGTENGFLATLAHEMCHYYTYMEGYIPKQGHGTEFRYIASIVSNRSNGMFTIQRLASAEQMSELDLSDEMKAKREKRLSNKKAAITAVFDFRTNGEVHLTTTSNQSLIRMIVSGVSQKGTDKVVTSNDAELIDMLFKNGYKKNMRTWRYWLVQNKPWINDLDKYDIEVYGGKKEQETPPVAQNNAPRRIFSLRTSNGTIEIEATSYTQLYKALSEKLPKVSGDALKKLINNPANYRLMENKKRNYKDIIRETLEDFIKNDNDTVEITPDMNLGEYSPLEIE